VPPTRRALLSAGLALPTLAWPATERVIARRRTPWGRIEVIELADGRRLLREDGQSHSLYDPAHPTALAYDYLQLLAAGLSVWDHPTARIAVIGLGGGSLCRWVGAHHPGWQRTAVELSRDVVRLARRHFDLDPAVEVHVADGRAFLDRGEAFDIVVLDASSEDYVPAHLTTVEFFRSLEAELVLMNSWRGAPRADDELATWCAAFDRPCVLTHAAPTQDNRVLLAAPSGRDVPKLVARRAAHLGVPVAVHAARSTGRVQHDPT